MKHYHTFKNSSIISISLWLILFAVLPIALMTTISFLKSNDTTLYIWHFTLSNYQQLFSNVFFKIFVRSLLFAFAATSITLLIAYPAAFIIAQSKSKAKPILLLLMIIPFWTSSLIRTYAILALLKAKGLVNATLLALGIIHQPLQILYTHTAVLIGVVYNLLPFMVLPLYTNIEKLDQRVFDAARDLGASKMKILFDITIPLTLPGIVAGTIFVFLPALTLFYIPDLLGGAKSILLGNLIENQFLSMNDWPGGSATSILLTVLMIILLLIYRRTSKDSTGGDLI